MSKLTLSINFYAKLIIIVYCFLHIIHWPLSPLFMDIYYHLHTAWGFIQAGGYSGWDFWQYAPLGRTHIYPPFFHILLAFFIKAGVEKIILVKCLEILLPVLFLIVSWYFMKRNYSSTCGFFILVMLSSSFSFYLSLINHLPATLAFILGILSLDQLFHRSLLRSTFLLALCFYTHIGVSWFFAISLILFGLLDRENRKLSLIVCLSAIILSLPVVIKQILSLQFIKVSDLYERYLCEFKTIDYLLAFIGIVLLWKLAGKYRLFLTLFLASFIFLVHPYRFFSAEGYLPIPFLSAISLNEIYGRLKNKKGYIRNLASAIIILILFVSPTVLMERIDEIKRTDFKVYNFDSAFIGLVFPEHNRRVTSSTLWYPNEYLPAASLIKENSESDDIIYCALSNVSVCLASLSGRATANGLLTEIRPADKFDPLSVSKIFIALQDDNPAQLNYIINKYSLIKIGENKFFVLYENPSTNSKVGLRKAALSFKVILAIGVIIIFLFWQAENLLQTRIGGGYRLRCGFGGSKKFV